MSRTKRIVAAFFAVLMLSDAILPTAVYALSTGPSQPEVQGFQPAGVNDMVNLFTGDFSYNIPLLDVEGYPVNLFYNAGVGMDQEASWVGLGWNLNPGVVERNLRGLPDDFNGDLVKRTMRLRPNRTVGVNVGIGTEVFGFGGGSVGIAPSFNNYNGPQFSTDVSLSIKSTEPNQSGMTVGLGLSSSSDRGLTVSPSVGYDRAFSEDGNRHKASLNFGLSLNSTQGLTNASFGATLKGAKKEDIKGLTNQQIERKLKRTGSVGRSFDLGSPTYTPQVTLPMNNLSLSFHATGGVDFMGVHPHLSGGAFYSKQWLRQNEVARPAYGYLNLQEGARVETALLDFNREKDGPYSKDRSVLGIASLTEDIFSVSGQGVSGSYRAFRSEVGHVFDAMNISSGADGSAGVELGLGAGAHFGMDVKVNLSSTISGDWTSGNQAGQRLRYRSFSGDPLAEPAYFREASEATVEQDSSLWNALQTDKAVRFTLEADGKFNRNLGSWLTDGGNTSTAIPTINYRKKREPRAQTFSYLKHGEAMSLGLDAPPSHTFFDVPDHHISEVSIAGTDGGRYVYGVPVYNTAHSEVEFNVGGAADNDGLVDYTDGIDNSVSNTQGKDWFYSESTTPPYAYAFLLSAVLSPDYSDIDGVRGPSDGDLGNYTKFTYESVDDEFPWRTPASPPSDPFSSIRKALFNPGLYGTSEDNKATYVYGTKEIKYLEKIETRNFIAIFHTTDRNDGLGVNEDGTNSTAHKLRKLDRISLYEKSGYDGLGGTAIPIKEVHFQYSDELCSGAANSSGGKLTLKRVWFTYGKSERGVTTPYVFDYDMAHNPGYARAAQDRWGNYRPAGTLPNDIFPYAEQDHDMADSNARAWGLSAITTPSGARITVEYEADDYASVQDKPAMRMLLLHDMAASPVHPVFDETGSPITNSLRSWNRLTFKVPPECTGMSEDQVRDALFGTDQDGKPVIRNLYFRSKVTLAAGVAPQVKDYVSGYAQLHLSSFSLAGDIGSIDLVPVEIDEGSGPLVNPIFRASLEFMRLNYPKLTHPGGPAMNSEDDDIIAMFYAMVTSLTGFITQANAFFQGPNLALAGYSGVSTTATPSESWIRVYEPDNVKKGGGHRVKSLRIADNWHAMETGEAAKSFTYGQEYTYGDEHGSFGVAAYEPMAGADENPWRQPVYGNNPTNALTPDERFYQETPFGESLFPSPVVGYSKVVVRDLYPDPLVQAVQGTGTVVHEFYTAKDFPTRVARTGIDPARGDNAANLLSIFGFRKIDHMHATQGFVVETNDMHGKPNRVTVYPEGSDQPVSMTKYHYATNPDGSGGLVNGATVIDPQGNIGRAEIGRQYEFLGDTREYRSISGSMGMMVNTELLPIPFLPFPIPIILPSVNTNSVAFRSGVFVKKIHRFGLLTGTTQMNNGSSVTTENLAYDALTGTVLLTKLTNAFEDPVYTFNFPAYWHYEGMGPAFRNIGAHTQLNLNSAGVATVPNAKDLFFPGDVLSLATSPGPGYDQAWVNGVGDNTVQVIDAVGDPVTGTWPVKVIRSGRKNMQAVNMMSLTLQSNPLEGMGANLYANLLDAKAHEFKDTWRAECACIDPGSPAPNEWLLNRMGMWRPWKDRVWLTDRTRSHYDNNANIRRDGAYTTFSPFYQVLNGQWAKDQAGWTTAREVTDYSARGQELENRDALGLYSSATFGYRGNLAKTVAKNARYQETGFDGFEESVPADCSDGHFRFPVSPGDMVEGDAHTGRYSLRVVAGSPITFQNGTPWDCPESPCDGLGISVVPDGNNWLVHAVGGVPPYAFSTNVQSGAPTFWPTPAGGLGVGLASNSMIQVTVTDANGCTATEILKP